MSGTALLSRLDAAVGHLAEKCAAVRKEPCPSCVVITRQGIGNYGTISTLPHTRYTVNPRRDLATHSGADTSETSASSLRVAAQLLYSIQSVFVFAIVSSMVSNTIVVVRVTVRARTLLEYTDNPTVTSSLETQLLSQHRGCAFC